MFFDLDGQEQKEGDLDSSTNSIEEASTDSVGIRPSTRRQKGRRPCPGRNGTGGDQTRFNVSGRRGEPLGVLHLAEISR